MELSSKNVMPCIYAARKYQLHGLVTKCENYLKKSICPANVCTIYEQARFYDIDQLSDDCFSFFIRNARQVLQNKDFLQLSSSSMYAVLENDLPVNEIELFNAIYHWGENQCRRVKEEATGPKARNQLGEMLYKIRLPLLTMQEFSMHVSPKGVLTQEEELLIFRYLARADSRDIHSPPDSSVGRFSCKKRCPQRRGHQQQSFIFGFQ